MEHLYQIEIKCLFCEKPFETSRVRPKFKKGISTDTDFCVHFNEVNPDYYVVRVCPFCGFSFTENFSNTMSDKSKKAFSEKFAKQWSKRDYGGERTWDEAMQTYKLALLCAQIKEEKDRVVAGVLHHIAWMNRINKNQEQEHRFLKYALDAYIRVYEVEEVELNNARLMYLIGELNRRLKNYKDAVQWFTRVVNDKKIMDSAMIRASREQWAATRENMQEEKTN